MKHKLGIIWAENRHLRLRIVDVVQEISVAESKPRRPKKMTCSSSEISFALAL